MDQFNRLAAVLLRHKWKMTLFFLGVMMGAAILTWVSPRSYSSQAKLLVRLGRENATVDSTTTLGNTPVFAVPPNQENDINSVVEIVKGRVLLDKVVIACGAEAILDSQPQRQSTDAKTGAAANALPQAAQNSASQDLFEQKTSRHQLAVNKLAQSLVVE